LFADREEKAKLTDINIARLAARTDKGSGGRRMRKRGKGGSHIGREGIRERRSRGEEAQECERGW
jgi:hypothetical protein